MKEFSFNIIILILISAFTRLIIQTITISVNYEAKNENVFPRIYINKNYIIQNRVLDNQRGAIEVNISIYIESHFVSSKGTIKHE